MIFACVWEYSSIKTFCVCDMTIVGCDMLTLWGNTMYILIYDSLSVSEFCQSEVLVLIDAHSQLIVANFLMLHQYGCRTFCSSPLVSIVFLYWFLDSGFVFFLCSIPDPLSRSKMFPWDRREESSWCNIVCMCGMKANINGVQQISATLNISVDCGDAGYANSLTTPLELSMIILP